MSEVAVSVVIPTFNRVAVLERALDALTRQTARPATFEVIVVDDGSTDATRSMLATLQTPYRLTYVPIEHSGVAVARNTGVSRARAPIVCFLDDDVVADPGLVEAYVRGHASWPAAVLVGRLSVVDESRHRALRPLIDELRDRRTDRDEVPGPFDLLTGNCALPTKTFLVIGGFDESLPSAEDFELALRLLKDGIELRHCPGATGTEIYTRGAEVFVGRAFKGGLAHALIVRKHPSAARSLNLVRAFSAGTGKRWLLRIAWGPLGLLRGSAGWRLPVPQVGSSALWNRLGVVFYWAGVRQGAGSFRQLRAMVDPDAPAESAEPKDRTA